MEHRTNTKKHRTNTNAGIFSRLAAIAVFLLSLQSLSAEAGMMGWFNDRFSGSSESTQNMIERMEIGGMDPGPILTLREQGNPDKHEKSRIAARTHYMMGMWLKSREMYDPAAERFQEALKNDPGSALIRLEIASCHLEMNNPEVCVNLCREIIREEPKLADAYDLLGKAYTEMGQADDAINVYREGLEELPECLQLLEPLGELYRQRGDIDGVLEIFDRVHARLREEERRSLYVMMILAYFFELDGQVDRAIETHHEAMRVYPGNVALHSHLGKLLLRHRRNDEALKIVKKGLTLDPTHKDLLTQFELAIGSSADLKKAYRDFADEYALLSEIQYMWASRSLEKFKDLESAEEGFRRVLEFEEDHRESLLGMGEIMRRKGQTQEAIKYYEKVDEIWPDENRAIEGLATAYLSQGDYEKSADMYKRLIELSPNEIEPYVSRSVILEELGQVDKAIDLIAQAVEIFDNRAKELVLKKRMGELLIGQGRIEEAIEPLEEVQRAAPGDIGVYRHLIDAYLTLPGRESKADSLVVTAREALDNKQLELFEITLSNIYRRHYMIDKSIQSLQRAVELNPNRFATTEQLIIQLILLRRDKEALNHLRETTAKYKDSRDLELALLWTDYHLSRRDYQDALDTLTPVLARGDSDQIPLISKMGIFQSYAMALKGLGRDEEALAICENLLKHATGEREDFVLQAVGDLYCDLDAWGEAGQIYERLVARSSSNENYQYQLGTIYDQLDKTQQAETVLRRVIEMNPTHYNALNHLGYMFVEEGRDLDTAIKLIRKALTIKPRAGYIIDSLGWAYFKKGQIDKAIHYLERAAAKQPADSEIYDHLGDALAKKGDTTRAIKIWRQALRYSKKAAQIQAKIEQAEQTLKK